MLLKQLWTSALVALVLSANGAPEAGAQPYSRVQELLSLYPYSISVDGTTAVIGTSEAVNGLTLAGAVYVYVKSGTTWTQQQRLTAPTPTTSQKFGYSVAVHGDTLAVGTSPTTGTAIERVYVYVRSGTTWTEQGTITLNRNSGERFGSQVSVHGDTIGLIAPVEGAGAAYLYARSGTTWTQQTRIPGASWSIDVQATTACVGNVGGASVYNRLGSTWTFRQSLTAPAATGTAVQSCALDGDSLAFGAPGTVGSAFVFLRTGSPGAESWSLQQQLQPAAPPAYGRLGTSIAVAGDYAAVGATPNVNGTGDYTYIFRRTGSTWSEVQRIGFSIGRTGHGLAVAVVGADLFTSAVNGAVDIYERAGGGAPGAPTNVQATVSGNNLSLTWGAPATGDAPTGYTLIARTAPGAPPVVTVPLGLTNAFGAAAPNGTFLLSLTATNAAGTGPESAVASATFPGGGPVAPAAPTGLAVSVSGSTATFTWTSPVAGGAPAGYVLHAGTAPGFATPFASLPLPVSPTSVSVPGVPVGTYYIRLVAQNAGGTSGPSNEVTLTVAGAVAPGAPTLNTPSVSGNTVNLSWTAGGGGAPSGYTLIATATPGGAPIVTVPLTGTSVGFAGVPSGTYFLRLTATNSAGTSAASNQVTLVVP